MKSSNMTPDEVSEMFRIVDEYIDNTPNPEWIIIGGGKIYRVYEDGSVELAGNIADSCARNLFNLFSSLSEEE